MMWLVRFFHSQVFGPLAFKALRRDIKTYLRTSPSVMSKFRLSFLTRQLVKIVEYLESFDPDACPWTGKLTHVYCTLSLKHKESKP